MKYENIYKLGQKVMANKNGQKLKADVVGMAQKFMKPAIYTLELPNGERIVANESELSPHEANVVTRNSSTLTYLGSLLAMIIVTILLSQF